MQGILSTKWSLHDNLSGYYFTVVKALFLVFFSRLCQICMWYMFTKCCLEFKHPVPCPKAPYIRTDWRTQPPLSTHILSSFSLYYVFTEIEFHWYSGSYNHSSPHPFFCQVPWDTDSGRWCRYMFYGLLPTIFWFCIYRVFVKTFYGFFVDFSSCFLMPLLSLCPPYTVPLPWKPPLLLKV